MCLNVFAAVLLCVVHTCHLSPSHISCSASVQPLITWFGAKEVGEPRS